MNHASEVLAGDLLKKNLWKKKGLAKAYYPKLVVNSLLTLDYIKEDAHQHKKKNIRKEIINDSYCSTLVGCYVLSYYAEGCQKEKKLSGALKIKYLIGWIWTEQDD